MEFENVFQRHYGKHGGITNEPSLYLYVQQLNKSFFFMKTFSYYILRVNLVTCLDLVRWFFLPAAFPVKFQETSIIPPILNQLMKELLYIYRLYVEILYIYKL